MLSFPAIKPVTCAFILLAVLVSGLGPSLSQVEAAASPLGAVGAREPIVSRPMGAFHLRSNPAAVVRVEQLGLHLGFQPDGEDGPYKLVAYSDPGLGLAAGALIWFESGTGSSAKREIAYTLGRFVTEHVAFGMSVKHVWSSAGNRWAGDLGLYIPVNPGLEVGVVYYDAFGATADDPGEIAASVSHVSAGGWVASVELSRPLPVSGDESLLSWAVDLPVGTRGVLRATRRGLISGDGTAEWLAALRWEFERYGFDAGVILPSDKAARIRLGFWFTF